MGVTIDFKALAAALLDRAESLMAEWLQGGRRQGREWVCADLSGGEGGSCSVNLKTGAWADFGEGGETGGDLVALYAAIHSMSNIEAARELIQRYGLQHCEVQASAPQAQRADQRSGEPPPVRAEPSDRPAPAAAGGKKASAGGKRESVWKPIVPVPEHAPAPHMKHWHYGAPQASWEYRFKGQLYGYILRYEKSDGGKEIFPHTWCVDETDERGLSRWHFKQWDEPRPLYVPSGDLVDGRTVVLVEGEKCARAGQELLGDVFDFVSWPGGAKAWARASWAWLKGRTVVMWPDCDAKRERLSKAEKQAGVAEGSKPILPEVRQPGMAAMLGIAELLQAQQACTVSVCKLPAPGAVPDGWDLADALAEGWDAARVEAFIRAALPFVSTSPEVRAAVAVATKNDPSAGAVLLDGAAGWRSGLLYAGQSIAKARENLVLALDGCELGSGKRLAGIPEAEGVIAFNEFSNQVVKLKPAPWGTPAGPWMEQDELEMGLWLTREHFLPPMPRNTLEEAVLMVAQRHTYHPVRARLESLRGTWDGVKRCNSWLKRYCAGEAEGLDATAAVRRDQYLARVGTWVLMAMCARAMRPGCKFDYMLILEGSQGLGKSTLARTLGGEWFADTGLQLGEKDSYQNLQGIWVYEMGELDALSRSEVTKVKQFISSQKDRFRASFDKRPRDYPRQCIFLGTTNEDHYLTDPTGNRRMWPVPVNMQIDIEALRAELDQLMAEALSYFEAGERFHPTPSEQRQMFEPEQKQRTVENAIESLVTDYLYDEEQKVPVGGSNGAFIPEISLIKLLAAVGIGVEKLTPGRWHEKQAAAALRKLGWVERRSSEEGRPRVYVRPKGAAGHAPMGGSAAADGTGAAAGVSPASTSAVGCPV
jgi:predicted P-loop ATPase